MLALLLVVTATAQAAPTSAARTLTAPDQYPALKGLRIKVPDSATIPPEDVVWKAVNDARPTCLFPCDIPIPWYEEFNSWSSHGNWRQGGAFNNDASTTVNYELQVGGSISATFSGTLPARLVVATQYNLLVSVSVSHRMTVPVPPNSSATLWGTAWGRQHSGQVHWDHLLCYAYLICEVREGGHSSVRFWIPSAPDWAATDTCLYCQPRRPAW